MRRLILAAFLSVSLLTGGCAAVAVKAGMAVEADIAKQQAWTEQMDRIVADQVDAFRLEIKRLERADNGFETAMDMRLELLAFMENWRPQLIVERLFERLRKIRKRHKKK